MELILWTVLKLPHKPVWPTGFPACLICRWHFIRVRWEAEQRGMCQIGELCKRYTQKIATNQDWGGCFHHSLQAAYTIQYTRCSRIWCYICLLNHIFIKTYRAQNIQSHSRHLFYQPAAHDLLST